MTCCATHRARWSSWPIAADRAPRPSVVRGRTGSGVARVLRKLPGSAKERPNRPLDAGRHDDPLASRVPVLTPAVVMPRPARRSPSVDIVVPALNEAHVLGRTLPVLHAFLEERCVLDWRIVVVDNGSTDGTAAVAHGWPTTHHGILVRRLDRKGRGGALRSAWTVSEAQVVAYMDADLSTGLDALPGLLDHIVDGGADVAIGSRLVPGSGLDRRPLRDVLSRGYNGLLRAVLRVSFRDAQCGFKAVRADVAQELLPLVRDDGWFFDTELLVTAERSGLTIVEVPVDWVDDSDSRVRILPTVLSDLRGIVRLLAQHRRLSGGGG